MYAVPIVFAALVGFLGGLLSFKVKTVVFDVRCSQAVPRVRSGDPVQRLIKRVAAG